MRILLISPQTPDTFWSFKHVLRFVSKKAAFPPLGLLTVAAMLPREWELRLVDLNVKRLRDEDLRWADYVMISAMIVHRESVRGGGGAVRGARQTRDRRRPAVHHRARGVSRKSSISCWARRRR